MPDFDNKDPGDWTTALINDYIELSPENHLQDPLPNGCLQHHSFLPEKSILKQSND